MEGAPKKPNDLENKVLNTKDILTFEEFSSETSIGGITFNNFPALFLNQGMFADALRSQSFFQKFQKENPELEESLGEKVRNAWAISSGISNIPKELLLELYEAYKIMIGYEEVETNQTLFG